MDDGLSDADVFGGDTSVQPSLQSGQNPNVNGGVGSDVLVANPNPQANSVQSPQNGMSDADVFGSTDEKQPDASVNKKPNDLAHDMALLEKIPPQAISDKDSMGQIGGKLALNQAVSVLPYFFDRNPDASTSQRVGDAVKSGATGLGQVAVGIPTLAADIYHNVPTYVGNKIGEAISGTDTTPDYSNYTGEAFHKLGLDYQPQTALGERMQLASNFAAPEVLPATAGKIANAGRALSDNAGVMKAGWKFDPEAIGAQVQGMKDEVSSIYGQMRNEGAVFTDDKMNAIKNDVNRAVKSADIVPKQRPVTNDVVQQINDAVDSGDMSLSHLDQYRSQLSDASGRDTVAAAKVRQAIDNHTFSTTSEDLQNGSPRAIALLDAARARAARAYRYEDVADLLRKTNGDPNLIKTRMRTFMGDDDNLTGFNDDEIAALANARDYGNIEGIAKGIGKFGFGVDRTGPGNTVLPAWLAMAKTSPFTTAAKAGATAFPTTREAIAAASAVRAGQKYYARGKAMNALDLIGNREVPPVPPEDPAMGLLEKPPIRSGPTKQLEYSPEDFNRYEVPDGLKQRQITDQTYRPTSRMLTYQPRPDFVGTDNGIVQAPSDRVGALLGEDQDLPIDAGELDAMRDNPKWPKQKAGGRVKKTKTGAVIAKPKSYPALEGRRA